MKTQILQIQNPAVMNDYADKITMLQDLMVNDLNTLFVSQKEAFSIVLVFKYSDHVRFSFEKQVFDYDPNKLDFLSVDDEIDIGKSFDKVLKIYKENGCLVISQEIPRNFFQKLLGFRTKFLLTFTPVSFGRFFGGNILTLYI